MEVLAKKIALSFGVDKDIINSKDVVIPASYAALAIKQVFDVILSVCSAEAEVRLFNTDDCKAIIYGKWTEEKITDNSSLNVAEDRNFTVVDPYLEVKVKGGAPEGKKHQGTFKGKKFIEAKAKSTGKTASKAKKAAPKKKGKKK
jgi:hypothetical protein